jgi:ComF family protein
MVAATPLHLNGLDLVDSVFEYEGRASQAVRRLKYRRSTSLAQFMSGAMRAAWDARLASEFDACTPVPIHWRRRAERGFNQSELLCAAIEPCTVQASLVRIRATKPQVGLSREARATNLHGAFACVGSVAGQRILLIDDVATTGSTARECADTLRAAGARKVGLLVFAQEV